MKYIIIDDEHIAHDIIKGYCDNLPHLELMANCYDAIEALAFLSKNEVDLIFLDLNMPKLKGFEFLKTLSTPPNIIVTTAYCEFALEGYELNVKDYLLKPFSFERFVKAINKVMASTVEKKKIVPVTQDQTSGQIFLRQNKSYIQVDLSSIQYIEAAGNYTKVYLNDDTITIREKISDMILSLPESEFIQVHKSFAIAVKHISSIEGNRIHIGSYIVPIGKMYKSNIDLLLK